jgi:NAD(P)-dependent dehydrogenase (short-subunit alcohol dehydrogenase family)
VRPVRGAGPRAGHALISGGSSGIGLELARQLAAAGWDLTLLARDPGRLAAAAAALAPHGVSVLTLSVDVTDHAGVAAAVAAANDRHGPVGLLVACAGMVVPGRLEDLPLDAFHRTIEVNYLGALHLVRAALPTMRRGGGARIVLVASGAALIGLYGYTAYAPSKFAVRGLAEALRSEVSATGIGVSVVYPPDTDTPGYRAELRQRPEITQRLAGSGGLATADAVAAAILRGCARGRFSISPGRTMTALTWLHSLVAPLLHRLWFDPIIASASRRGGPVPRSTRQPTRPPG